MSKPCRNCGAELPENASFCPHCAQSQIDRAETKSPRLWRKKALCILGAALILAAAALAVVLSRRPRTFEGGAFVTYTDKDGTYDLLAAFFPGDILHNRPIGSKTVSLPAEEENMDTPMIGVYQDGALADAEAFFSKVERCTLEAFPNENCVLRIAEPAYSEDSAPAAREASIFYTGDCGTNELVWTLTMKNGDTIRLKQTYEVIPLIHQVYTPENAAMDTLEDLQALLSRIDEEVPEDVVVDIYLPPVTYTGDLQIVYRGVNLYGSSNGPTVFQGSLAVYSDIPSNVMLFDLNFAGSGGVGLSATASVYMGGCTFTGWDVGAVALDGGMIGVENCVFRENGIGFKYNSASHQSFNDVFPGSLFENNGIGVQFKSLEGTMSIDFAGTTFSGNRTDIDNPISYPIKTDGAIFR